MSNPYANLSEPQKLIMLATNYMHDTADDGEPIHTSMFKKLTGQDQPLLAAEVAIGLSRAIAHSAIDELNGEQPTFKAVAAPTGAGKSVSAMGFILYALEHDPDFTCSLVVENIKEVDVLYHSLARFLDVDAGELAVRTSLHHVNAEKYEDKNGHLKDAYYKWGLEVQRFFTDKEIHEARVVVGTHEAWRSEIKEGRASGIVNRHVNGKVIPRSLVLLDEDPQIMQTFTTTPSEVAALADTLSGHIGNDDLRSWDLVEEHPSVKHIRAFHDILADLLDKSRNGIHIGTRIPAEDANAIMRLTKDDIMKAYAGAPNSPRVLEEKSRRWDTIQFMQAAVSVGFFHSRTVNEAIFYAYNLTLPGQSRHVILDASASLNFSYHYSEDVQLVRTSPADYSRVEVHHVEPPKRFKGKMRAKGLLEWKPEAKAYMDWLKGFVINHTSEGEEVLIYVKVDIVGRHDLPKELEDEPKYPERNLVNWGGRKVHIATMGQGRGSNAYRDCTAYFRAGDLYMPKSAYVAQVGSVLGRPFEPAEARSMSAVRTKDPLLTAARDSHVLINNQQDAARIAIRKITNDGLAGYGRIYLIDVDHSLLYSRLQDVWPGVKGITRLNEHGQPWKAPARSGTVKQGKRSAGGAGTGPQKLHAFLMETDREWVSFKELSEVSGIHVRDLKATLSTQASKQALQGGGWVESTLKAIGQPGRGTVLKRAASRGSEAR